MPSLRKRVSSYFRQLSFINEPKERKINFDENSMVNKYLQGHIKLKDGPQILYGKNPTDLPNFDLGNYNKGFESIVGCYSGPNGGLTTVKRTEKHLSMPGDDIDFIDTQEEINTCSESQKSPILTNGHTVVDNTTMVIRVAGQEYSVINRLKHKKSRSLGSLSDLGIEIEKTKICTDLKKSQNDKSDLIFLSTNNNKINDNKKGGSVNRIDNDNTLRSNSNTCKNINNNDVDLKNVKCVNKEKTEIDDNGNKSNNGKKTERKEKKMMSEKNSLKPSSDGASSRQVYNLSKSKSDGNPFRHRKQGKIIKITHRPTTGPGNYNLKKCLARMENVQ